MTTKQNPLLKKLRIPGETFKLPSGGKFYNDEIISESVSNGEVQVFPMTATEELLLKSPDNLFSGKGITQTIQRCVPDILQPELLLIKDVDFLMACIRKVTYGDTLTLNWTHSCENAKSHEYNINVASFIQNSKQLDPTKQYTLKLKQTGQTIHFRPPRFKELIALLQMKDKTESQHDDVEDMKTRLVQNILSSIDNVDGVTEPEFLTEWLLELPVQSVQDILNNLDMLSDWGPDFLVKQKCKDCGEEIELIAPINPTAFFI